MENERPTQPERKASGFLKGLVLGTEGEEGGPPRWQRVGIAVLCCLFVLRSLTVVGTLGVGVLTGTWTGQGGPLWLLLFLDPVVAASMVLYGLGLLMQHRAALSIQRIFLVLASLGGVILGPFLVARMIGSRLWSQDASSVVGTLIIQNLMAAIVVGCVITLLGCICIVLTVRTMRSTRVSVLGFFFVWVCLNLVLARVYQNQ